MKNLFISLLLVSLLAFSCEMYQQDEYEEFNVVEAYLIAGKEIPNIRLITVVPVEDKFSYSTSSYGVDNANIEVRLLSEGPHSEIEEVIYYELSSTGKYSATDSHTVLPLRTYELEITFPNTNENIYAHTIVPDTFQIVNTLPDSIVYRSSEQVEVTVSESSYPERQNIFIFNAISPGPEESKFTPFYRELFEERGRDPRDIKLLANNSSDIINEGNFKVNEDGSNTIKYPWSGFSYYEENLLVANTMDDNVYDFVRSQSVQLGGSSLSPGEIQNVIYNIEGGIGIFGSLASDTVAIYLKRP
ncbi:MAG: DUF4249 family protein [Balneolaceae bacterium]